MKHALAPALLALLLAAGPAAAGSLTPTVGESQAVGGVPTGGNQPTSGRSAVVAPAPGAVLAPGAREPRTPDAVRGTTGTTAPR